MVHVLIDSSRATRHPRTSASVSPLYTSIHNIFSRGSLQKFDQNFHTKISQGIGASRLALFFFALLCTRSSRSEKFLRSKRDKGWKGAHGISVWFVCQRHSACVCAAASRFSSYLNAGRPGLRTDSHVIMFCHWVVLFKLPHFLGHNVMNNRICQTK